MNPITSTIKHQATQRYRATCAYDGTDFLGWQSQPQGATVQDTIEQALSTILQTPIRIHGSGRTDAGVHAYEQVFHFDAQWPYATAKLQKALSTRLSPSIQIHQLTPVEHTFHARYSAIRKAYVYQIYHGYAPPHWVRYYWSIGERSLDFRSMKKAAQHVLGEHDFTGFSCLRPGHPTENPIKHLYQLDIIPKGQQIIIHTQATGYLYKMVRTLVGMLLCVGYNQLSVPAIADILRSKKRPMGIPTAPPHGLFLQQVFYT